MSDQQVCQVVEKGQLQALIRDELDRRQPGKVVGFLTRTFSFCLILIMLGTASLCWLRTQVAIDNTYGCVQSAEAFLGHAQTVQYAQAYADRANALAQMEAEQNKMLFNSCQEMAKNLIVLQYQLESAIMEIERLQGNTEHEGETCDENSCNLPNLIIPTPNARPQLPGGSSQRNSTAPDASGTAGSPEA